MVTTSLVGAIAVIHPAVLSEVRGIVLVVGAPSAGLPSDVVVVPIPYEGWLRREERAERCWYAAGQLLALADEVLAGLGLARRPPIALFGQGPDGAVVVAAAALQAPPTAFVGALAVGLRRPQTLTRPWCDVPLHPEGRSSSTTPLTLIRPQPEARAWLASLGVVPGEQEDGAQIRVLDAWLGGSASGHR